MRQLLAFLLGVFLCAASASATPYVAWCSKGYDRPAVMLVTPYVSILYVKGRKPTRTFERFQVVVGGTGNDLIDGSEVWIVEDRYFRVCKDQTLPGWVRLDPHALDDTIPLTGTGIRPAASP